MKDNFPPNAMLIKFKPLGLPLTRYRVWLKDSKYYWAALGHSGWEVTIEAAMRAAREYILMGVGGLPKYNGALHEGRQ